MDSALDPQLGRFLRKLSFAGGRILLGDVETVRQIDETCALRAERRDLVRFALAGPFGLRSHFELTPHGWRALGLTPPQRREHPALAFALRFLGLR
ncbi:hypothetical protein [Flaviflagellibacter deserti]|uniref:Uncharacterized protein n=1 Tax=Flaviflagellibacter deserti TaxID=2267266 RepID=A0ABV9Z3D8_9HYPH